ncbi:MAG TPA: methyltransferase domain-containing protein [Pyrinomonadaceae bacterium]|jgi:SAM-dependent methyltransferase|nr:methyltransferase domain-containing protein [Pyrinomonadaceae bacterium]
MPARVPTGESRSEERLRAHYAIEKELAERLRRASKQERRVLYTTLYDELFRRVPDHPQLARKRDPKLQAETIQARTMLKRFLRPDSVYLEIGPGDCALARDIAAEVKRVYAVDVSEEIAGGSSLPANFELALSDGCTIPVPDGSINVAYSDQLMEHLHPDDALEQLRNIHTALAPGGVYICLTPNRLSGPHDISRYFDERATGFHLKEYTATELLSIFRTTGFSKVKMLAGARGIYLPLPSFLFKLMEGMLVRLPVRLSKSISRSLPLRLILGIRLVAMK